MGPGLAIDTERFFVVCVNSLGSCFGSTGPPRSDPATGKPYRLDFPDLSVEDIARAGFETARSLGVERASTPSWAPRSAAWWCSPMRRCFPERRGVSSCISGTAAAAPFAIALRSIQRETILRDPDWRGGAYTAERPPVTGHAHRPQARHR